MKNKLDNIIQKNKMIPRAFESFWNSYDSYLLEESEESKKLELLNRNSITAELYGYSFCVTKDLDFDWIKVCIDFFLKDETTRLGTYWCIYNLDGDLFDDYFVIE